MINQDTETRLMFFMKDRKIYKYTTDEAINYLLDLVEELEEVEKIREGILKK